MRTKLDMMRPEDNVEKENDHVFTRTRYDPHWRAGIIKKKLGTRLYVVKPVEGGKKVRRHVDQIRRRDELDDPTMLPELVKLPRSAPYATPPIPVQTPIESEEEDTYRDIRPTTPIASPPSRPQRTRTRPKRLQVDPSKKRYDSLSD